MSGEPKDQTPNHPDAQQDISDLPDREVEPDPSSDEPDRLTEACERAGLGETVAQGLREWLLADIEHDAYARLEQAGHNAPERIALARVFVDLEVLETAESDAKNPRDEASGFIKRFNFSRNIRIRRFNRQSQARQPSADKEIPSEGRLEAYVLIGGPGQGKSTLGQLLCQLYRAKLLRPSRAQCPAHQQAIIDSFGNDQARKELGAPVDLFFPLRIVLADAAAFLAKTPPNNEGPPSLLRFVEDDIKRRLSDSPLQATHLLKLLKAQDWLLVLDGLDEVPAAADRERVLQAMDSLIKEISIRNKSLLIATTRPQGYAGELERLSPEFQCCYLAPLGDKNIQTYIDRLVQARYPGHRSRIVSDRLHQALQNEATRRLMTSPLQITIMATLVDRIGRAPQERWTLFREYYRVIYEREMERDIPAAALLRDYKNYIDKIHMQSGLLLQVDAEQSGGTSSLMSRNRYHDIVDAALAEDDMDGQQRERLADELVQATMERLVLLVEPRPGQFGFEIRSLQEFMAAWAIAKREDTSLQTERIRQIAKAPAFRNTLLFLAGKAFCDLSEMRDVFCDGIIPALNEDKEDAVLRELRAGSVLALEILEEGSALKQSKYARKLVEAALLLLQLPPSEIHPRLGRAVLRDEDARRVGLPLLMGEIRRILEDGQRALGSKLSAWAVLLVLIDAGEKEAIELGERGWPKDREVRRQLLSVMTSIGPFIGLWLFERAANSLEDIDPGHIRYHIWPYIDPRIIPPIFRALLSLYGLGRTIALPLRLQGEAIPFSVEFEALDQSPSADVRALAQLSSPPALWLPFVAAARIIDGGSKDTLADVLRQLADVFDRERFTNLGNGFPWPLSACLNSAKTADELRHYAQRAAKGDFGDREDWLQAERHWLNEEIFDLEALAAQDEGSWPLDPRQFERGPAVMGAYRLYAESRHSLSPELANALCNMLRQLRNPHLRRILLNVLVDQWTYRTEQSEFALPLTPEDVDAYWAYPASERSLGVLVALQIWNQAPELWLDRLDQLGRASYVYEHDYTMSADQLIAFISSLYRDHPDRTGLLPLLAELATEDSLPQIPPSLLQPLSQFSDPRIRDSARQLLVAQGHLDPVEATVEARLSAQSRGDDNAWLSNTLSILRAIPHDSPLKEPILLDLLQHIPSSLWDYISYALNSLHSRLSSRISGLSEPRVWERLKFPLPYPERHLGPDSSPETELRSPRIESITFRNFRTFEHLVFEPSVPTDPDHGQWIVLLGENGTGKTTFLRGLLFALIDPKRTGIVPSSVLSATYRRTGMGDNDECSVRVKRYDQTKEYDVRIVARYGEDDFETPHIPAKAPPFLFAYGAQRGSAMGGAKRDVNFNPGAPFATLLDEGANLVHAETWLLLRIMDKGSEQAERLWASIEQVLLALLPGVTRIEEIERRLWFSGPCINKTVLAGMSDGYLTTLGWTVDMIARWVEIMERRKETIPPAFHQTMTGLVLLDEIDLHLHPEWQRRVIRDLRQTFPRMSFVVTTHNPLCLLGARPEEIWTFSRNGQDKIVASRGKQLPALMTAAQILKQYFGIERTFPDPMGEKLQRLSFLVGSGARTAQEDSEMYELVREFRREHADPGWITLPEDESRGSGRR